MSDTGKNCPIQFDKIDPATFKVNDCQWRTEEQESLLDSVIKTYKNIGYMEGYIAALKDLQKRGKGND